MCRTRRPPGDRPRARMVVSFVRAPVNVSHSRGSSRTLDRPRLAAGVDGAGGVSGRPGPSSRRPHWPGPRTGATPRDGLAPLDDVQPLADELDGATADILIVGHLPFLARLAGALLTGNADACPVAFECSTAVCLERDDAGWYLRWALPPNLLGNP